MSLLSKLIAKLEGKASVVGLKGSASVKVAEAEVKSLETKGRIAALDAYTKVHTEAIAVFEKEAARVHADVDAVKTKYDSVLAKL